MFESAPDTNAQLERSRSEPLQAPLSPPLSRRRQAAVSQARRSPSKAFTTGACGAGQAGDATRRPPV